MEKTTITLQTDKQVDPTKAYLLDFSKMNSVQDMILCLSAIGFSFQGNHPFIEQLKPFLNLERPIDLNPQPQQKEIQLPKLQKVNKDGK